VRRVGLMMTIMNAMNAVSCVASARPRPAGQIRLAVLAVAGQGTTVSIVRRGTAVAVLDAPFAGDISVDRPTYKTTDVARFRLGRPPV
jgi:hypothetical protein